MGDAERLSALHYPIDLTCEQQCVKSRLWSPT